MNFRSGRIREAIPYFEKAAALMDTDWHNPSMLMSCYQGLGDEESRRRMARMTLDRAQLALAKDPTNGAAISVGVSAIALFGEADRAREWIERGLLLDPDNLSMRYNMACALILDFNEVDEALDILETFFARVTSATHIRHMEADPDLDKVRDDPRFQEMLAGAKKRLGLVSA
jgi:adenylate cyclase